MTEEASRYGDELTARVGELRRLTIMFCDVVGSTELSGRLEPETYRELMRGYRDACRDVIESRFEGHIVRLQGDGTLASFGFPVAHENDAERGVRAGLALVRAVRDLSQSTTSAAGESLEVRVAVHHGPIYLDFDEDDIYGLAANVGARLHSLADPGQVVISDKVRHLVGDHFEIEACEPQIVRGVAEPLASFCVVGERAVPVQRSWSTPLVEREAELEQLRHAWSPVAAATADRAAGVLLRGDAGVGKSRLVAVFVDEVCAGNARVVELRGSPFHVDAGFHPVRSLIEARCGIGDYADPAGRLESLNREVTNLGLYASETVPLLALVLDIEPSAGYEEVATEGRKLEEQVAQAVRSYVLACTQRRSAILLAENLHWFDEATRVFLEDLMRAGPGNVLVVGTSRDAEPGLWDTIELRPLTLAGRFALIDALDESLTEEDRQALATRSDGIPLYLEELVRAGAAQGPVGTGDAAPVPGSVPEVLYEPLVARLYATPAALPVAATAAAAGQEVDRPLLAATMSIPDEELDSTLQDLVDARILEPIAGRSARFQFRHELLREVAYELQPPSWRRKVHSRLCDLLTRDEPGDWRVLASHFERAERYFEAAEAYQHTAETARRRGALAEARAHLTLAIDLVMPLTDGAARNHLEVEMRLRRGFLAMSTEGGGSEDASADFERCLELTAADPQGDDMFSTLISLWSYYLSLAELDRARQVSETLRAALTGERAFFRPQNRASFAFLDWYCGNFSSAVDGLTTVADELAAMGTKSDITPVWFVPGDPTVAIYVHLALAQFMAGDQLGSTESLARAQALAAPLDFPQAPWSRAYSNWLGYWIWIEADRLDLAEEAVADLTASSARHGFEIWEVMAATQSAVLEGVKALRSGSADAEALSEHADAISAFVEIWQTLHLRVFLPFYLTTIGALLAAASDIEGARQRYEESLQLASETGMRFYDAETARLLAHLAPDREAEAAELRIALELAHTQAARPFELRIAQDLHDLLGDDNGATTTEVDVTVP